MITDKQANWFLIFSGILVLIASIRAFITLSYIWAVFFLILGITCIILGIWELKKGDKNGN